MKDVIYIMGNDVKEHQWQGILKKYSFLTIGGVISQNYYDVGKITIEGLKEVEEPVILLIGHGWEEDMNILQNAGYILWNHIIPEWGMRIMQDRTFRYLDIKKYTNNDPVTMGRMFAVITELAPIATVFGNCHTHFLNKIMENTDVIIDNFIICYFPFIQHFTDEKSIGIHREYLQHIDLFIYQNVGAENKFSRLFDTDQYILPALKEDAKKCCIPFAYFEGYFPQHIPNVRDPRKECDGIMPYGDSKIQNLLEQGKTPLEIESILNKDNLFSTDELIENVDRSLNELRKREKECDISISDYIEENYKEKCLFYTPSHPVTDVLVEVMRRVYTFLEIKNYSIRIDKLPENDGLEMIIYPSVKRKLGLEFEKKTFRFNRDIENKKSSLMDYIVKYQKYCFPEFSDIVKMEFRSIFVPHLLTLNADFAGERHIKKVILNGRHVTISIYLNLLKDDIDGEIGSITDTYAPLIPLVFNGTLIKSNRSVLITINSEGSIKCTIKRCKHEILLFNARYFMK